MKIRVLIIVILMTLPFAMFGQIRNGFWQSDSPNVSDTYDEGYKFRGNTFEYCVSGYDGLNPIVGFGGTYIVKNKQIFFTITFMRKLIGGQLSRDEFETSNNFWSLNGGKLTTIALDKPIKEEASIEIFKEYIEIDGDKFYLIKEQKDS